MPEPRLLAASQARISAALGQIRRTVSSPRSQSALYWASVLLVASVLGSYLAAWTVGNWEMLTDPRLQNSDARTSIFPFHRYARPPGLETDPIADEMLAMVPFGVQALYRVLVPLTDVHVAPKIVQGLCLGILAWAAVLLGRSRRAGFGAAALISFLVLHDWFAVYRLAGGLPRAFGFPLFALWLAATLAAKPWVRRGAALASAATYPSVMNLILAAEGIYACRGLGSLKLAVLLRRLKRYALLVACCVLLVLPSAMGESGRGPVHTLEQAQQEPAFGKAGRLWILPFASPTESLSDAFIDPLRPRGQALIPSLAERYARDRDMSAVLVIGIVLLLPLLALTPPPWLALAFASGGVVLYALSRSFAFRLYSPERYYSFGMRMALMALLLVILTQSFAFLRGRSRQTARNFAIAGFMLALWCIVGSGIVKKNGMTIDQRRDQALYEFIAQLPKTVRIATHPMDGDGIPYYSARATMGSFETLQPWFVDSWRRQRARTEDTLRALYAEDAATAFGYSQRNQVTHFLLDRRKYKSDLIKRSASFEPFSAYAKQLLAHKKPNDLFFHDVPDAAVVYKRGNWQLVDVARLAKSYTPSDENDAAVE
jgi:hypothetical protein